VLVVHRDVNEPNVCLPKEYGAHGTAASCPYLTVCPPCLCSGPNHSHWGSVCTVMPSDGSHMSVCVDQALSSDNNEPCG